MPVVTLALDPTPNPPADLLPIDPQLQATLKHIYIYIHIFQNSRHTVTKKQ